MARNSAWDSKPLTIRVLAQAQALNFLLPVRAAPWSAKLCPQPSQCRAGEGLHPTFWGRPSGAGLATPQARRSCEARHPGVCCSHGASVASERKFLLHIGAP